MVIKSNDVNKLKTDLTSSINKTFKNGTSLEIPNGMTKEEFISIQVNQIFRNQIITKISKVRIYI